ncbi:MAG: GNAT family protein [Armatimonas sp.]
MAFQDAFRQFPTIETTRLILSEISFEDASAYHHQQCSALELPDRPPWGFGFEMESVEKVRSAIQFSQNAWKKKTRLRFGIRLKPESHSSPLLLIGCCELFDFTNQFKAELGYWLGAAYHNQGLMTEAVQAVVAYGFDTMGLGRIFAHTSTRNLPSIALLKKVGFVPEGVLRQDSKRDGQWDDTALMAILPTDFTSK